MLGTTLFRAQIEQFALSKTAYEPAMIMGAHAHEFAYASLVVEGHYAEHSSSAPRHLHRGMLVFHPAGEVHADCVLDQAMATFNVEFLNGDLPREFICARGARVDELTHALLSALPACGRPLESSLVALRDFLWNEASPAPAAPIAVARDTVPDAYGEAPVSSLAAKLGMHRARFHRAFKRAYGESPRGDLTKRRTTRAARLLVDTTLSIAAIAAECGYYDQSHFCRQFRTCSGLSPSRFRTTFAP
ncbi:MAG TPA: helix-turn-helix transcriptional regulator [Candidatus Cybelea sp.]|nr:helix-turn-helix transcriptional regulator [Candidatus Cybelea sp.]